MLKTLLESKQSTLRNIAGSCPNSDAFMDLVNEGSERLIDAGDWDGLVFPIYLCAHKGCVVFPDFVGTIRALNICKQSMPVNNVFWSFIPENLHSSCCTPFYRGSTVGLNAQGYSPVFTDIYGEGRYVRAYAQANADIGKTVTVFGTDNYGQPLMHKDDLGVWQEGVVITLAKPYGSTNTYVRKIDRLVIDEMEKPITLFGYNATGDVLEPIGEYLPGNTNPNFLRYKLTLPTCVSCDQTVPLLALIKVKYRPVRNDNDLVCVPKLSALKDICQSIKESEARNPDLADYYEKKAIRGLNLQLWSKTGENIPVTMGEFAGTNIGMQRVF